MNQHNKRKLGKLVIIASISILALISFKVLASGIVYEPTEKSGIIASPGVHVIDRYEKDDGYYIFLPEDESKITGKVVGFIHGYGALNPMIFGAWIKHLVDQGHTIIYPRYQKNLIFPSATQFTPNVTTALERALDEVRENHIDVDWDFFLFGHSFGGVIASNIMASMEEHRLPKPKGAFVAEGGTGPFTGALLDSYRNIPHDIPLVIVVGDRDFTVGDYFGRRLFDEAEVDHMVYVHQKSYADVDHQITSSHYEPYAIDDWCDNGFDNLTLRRAMAVGKIDVLDHNGYWKWLDTLIQSTDDWDISASELFNPGNPLVLRSDGKILEGAISARYKWRP